MQPSSVSKEAIKGAINKTLLNTDFMRPYKENCEKDRQICKPEEPGFYNEQDWFVKSMKYALRDSTLVKWQVDYWEKSVLNPAKEKAKKANFLDSSNAGIIGMASMGSSAPSWARYFVKEATGQGYVTNDKANLRWEWDKHPYIANPTPEQLESWHLLVRWQYYVSKKGYIRNRSAAYFVKYLAGEWELPNFHDTSEWKEDSRNWDPNKVTYKNVN